VSVEGRRVSVETVEAAAAEAKAGERALYRERSAARYARTVSLPAEVDQTASQARFDNGVLTLTLAKKVPTGATQLQVS
jgi:HSP20 family protein